MLFTIGLIVFAICAYIQFRAMNRTAWSRSMLITLTAFLIAFMISLSPHTFAIMFLVRLFEVLGWGFLLFITYRSLEHIGSGKWR
jgi:hypothetical protein